MKKSTLAVASLLAVLSAPVVSVAYADDTTTTSSSATDQNPCAAKCEGKCSGKCCGGSSD